MRTCRKCDKPVMTVHAFDNAAATDSHPLARVVYLCGHNEFVRHEHLFQGGSA